MKHEDGTDTTAPHFPPDLERTIFELAALSSPGTMTTVILVALRRVTNLHVLFDATEHLAALGATFECLRRLRIEPATFTALPIDLPQTPILSNLTHLVLLGDRREMVLPTSNDVLRCLAGTSPRLTHIAVDIKLCYNSDLAYRLHQNPRLEVIVVASIYLTFTVWEPPADDDRFVCIQLHRSLVQDWLNGIDTGVDIFGLAEQFRAGKLAGEYPRK
ncbi:hypothetical protein B0H16DRAFT_1711136 [Mycena metata]|uniref:Uncharacterized protein n=1 Tax=Mycena metata TaxID=1033252 RepID=A0AAD7K7G3_9AGAR|nr:hypothetical protein B0H16DRAFT_1711136 [Mycena metata]